MKLIIDEGLCTACKQCSQVCIRDNLVVEDFAIETGGNCFECGHCMAICKVGAITLKSYEGKEVKLNIKFVKLFCLAGILFVAFCSTVVVKSSEILCGFIYCQCPI